MELLLLSELIGFLFNIGTLAGIFTQIKNGKPFVRDGCFKFLSSRLKDLSPEIADFHFQKFLYAEVKRQIRVRERCLNYEKIQRYELYKLYVL